MKNTSEKLLVKGLVSSGFLLPVSGVFAHVIIPAHTHVAVPLSLTSTIVLGILLIFTGLFVLPRMQGRHIRMLATTTFVAGIIAAGAGGKLVSDALAIVLEGRCTIESNLSLTGDCALLTDDSLEITNGGSSPIRVTFNDNGPHGGGDARNTAPKKNSLQIVKLAKGPIQRSVVMGAEPCADGIIEAGESCFFDHFGIHNPG